MRNLQPDLSENMDKKEFNRFAAKDRGINPMTLHRYEEAVDAYVASIRDKLMDALRESGSVRLG